MILWNSVSPPKSQSYPFNNWPGERGRGVRTIEFDILPRDCSLCLIIFIQGYLHALPLDRPRTDALDEPVERIPPQAQPALQQLPRDLPIALRHGRRDPQPDELFEPDAVGDEVGAEVVAVERRPELPILAALEEAREQEELLHRLGERVDRRVAERVRGEEVQAEAKVGRREDGERLDEDVCDGLVSG